MADARTITRYTQRATDGGRLLRFVEGDDVLAEGRLSRASLMSPASLAAMDGSWAVIIEPLRRVAPTSWRVVDDDGGTIARIDKGLLAYSAQVSVPNEGVILELRPPDGPLRDLAKRAAMLHSATTLLMHDGEVVGSLGGDSGGLQGLGRRLASLGKGVVAELGTEWVASGALRLRGGVAADPLVLAAFLFVREVIDRERTPG